MSVPTTRARQPHRAESRRRPIRLERIATWLVITSITLLWLRSWIPGLLAILLAGRRYAGENEFGSYAIVSAAGSVTLYGAIATATLALLLSLHRLPQLRALGLVVALATWAVIYVTYGYGAVPTAFIFPLLVAAWILADPPRMTAYRLLAFLGIVTAGASLLFAIVSPLAFMPAAWSVEADKGLLGGEVLAGIYTHSNLLGLTMVLSLPFVVVAMRGRVRAAGLTIVLVALVLSASRISAAASAISLLLLAIVRWAPRTTSRRLLTLVILATTAVILAFPLAVTDPAFLTNRGFIWMTTLQFAMESPLFGHGPTVFLEVSQLTVRLNYVSSSGHNVFVTLLTTGGIVAVALFSLMLIIAVRNARSMYWADPVPLVFIAILLPLAVAEDPVRALSVSGQSFVIFPMLAVALAGGSQGRALPFVNPDRSSRSPLHHERT